MSDPEPTVADASEKPTVFILGNLCRHLGLILKNNQLGYWLSRRDADEAEANCFHVVETVLQDAPEVEFLVGHEDLTVNGCTFAADAPYIESLMGHLAERDIRNFSLLRGLTLAEFRHIIKTLGQPPETLDGAGGLTAVLRASGIQSLHARSVVYKAVAEDEIVVSKEGHLVLPLAPHKVVSAPAVEHILAYLHGDVAQPDDETVRQAQDVISDVKKTVELIIKAADIREQPPQVEHGESFTDIVVGSLRRSVHALMNTPAGKSQKGKKNLARSLVLIEKDLLESLRSLSGGNVGEHDRAALAAAVEELSDDLQLDGLAAEYMRRRRAVEQSESRVRRYLHGKALEDASAGELRKRLAAEGLDASEWYDLMARSGAGPEPPPTGAVPPLGQLAMLIARLESVVTQVQASVSSEQSAKLAETAATLQLAVDGAATETQQKIRELGRELAAEQAHERRARVKPTPKFDEPAYLPRRRILTILAEIVQELCQPLSVINCSLQMLAGGRLGHISESQRTVIKLAQESADRIKMLADSIRDISGEPTTLSPDLSLTASFYER